MTIKGSEFVFYITDEQLEGMNILTQDNGEVIVERLARIFLEGIFGKSIFHRATVSCVRDPSRRAFEVKAQFLERGWDKKLVEMEDLVPVMKVKTFEKDEDGKKFFIVGEIAFRKPE